MKTTALYLLSFALLLLAGCQKEFPMTNARLSGEAICFDSPGVMLGVESSPWSKAPIETTLPTGSSFGVLGYCLANYDGSTQLNPTTGTTPWESKMVLCSPHLFYKREVKFNGTTCYYTGKQERWYEPSDYLYTFYAYYPYGDTYYAIEPITQSGIGAPSLTFSMPFSGGEISTPRDINQIPDAMAAAAVDVTRGDGHVKLQFQHLLAGFNFTVNNYNETNDLTIHGVQVSGNFYRSIKIKTNQGLEYPSETFAGTFTFLDGSNDADDITVEHQKTVKKLADQTLMLISNLSAAPNYIGNDITILLDYSFMGKRTTGKSIALPGGYLPQGGTLYTVELNFIGDAFILNFVVDNNQVWEDGGDSGIQFE